MRHNERTHALLSASGAHRWLACPPSALLEEKFPDTSSDAAAEGTLAHELAELKAGQCFLPVKLTKARYANKLEELMMNEHWNAEMMGYTDEYIDYLKAAAMRFAFKPSVAIERRLDLSAYIPGGFGTTDCILIGGDTLHVIDFKYGKGVPVDAKENPQMMLYALGAYEAYRCLYSIKRVLLSIVQPRIPDGTSEWELSIERLLEFGAYASGRAALAIKGEGEFSPSKETCRFCRAKTQCRARAEENVRLAFGVGKKPPLITREEAGRYLEQGTDIASWLTDLKDWALAECLAGREVPGWKAVEGRSVRKWTDAELAFQRLKENGIREEILYVRNPLTLAQVEATIGKKDFAAYVGDLVKKAPGSPALVPASDKRQAITNRVTADEAFAKNREEKKDE